MNLKTLLTATLGPRGQEDSTGWAKVKDLLTACPAPGKADLLASLDQDLEAELTARGSSGALIARHVIITALTRLCAERTEWTTEQAFHALAVCRRLGRYEPLGGLVTLETMAHSGVSFPPGARREREFAALVDHLGDVGEEGRTRRAAYALFGKVYVPRLVSSHGALVDEPFQRYLTRLIGGLQDLVALRDRVRRFHPDWYGPCSGQALSLQVFAALAPPLHPLRMGRLPAGGSMGHAGTVMEFVHWRWGFAFKNVDLAPIDRGWVAEHAGRYRRWEEAHGDCRWIEHLPPALPPEFPTALAPLLGTATGAKPSARWTKSLRAIVVGQEQRSRAGVLAMLHGLGAAQEVRASETAWADAAVYAFLHLEYRRSRADGHEPVDEALPDLLNLPWLKNGTTVLHRPVPPNPMALSEANTAFGRGLAWAAPLWPDTEMVVALASAAGGAAAELDLGDRGRRIRSLAVFTACATSLAEIGSPQATTALATLRSCTPDPRAHRCLDAAGV